MHAGRVDLTELATAALAAERVLARIVARRPGSTQVAPPQGDLGHVLLQELRATARRSRRRERESGARGMHLGYPFLSMRRGDATDGEAKLLPAIAWPLTVPTAPLREGRIQVAFDSARRVELNPTLRDRLPLDVWQRLLTWVEDFAGRADLRPERVLHELREHLGDLALDPSVDRDEVASPLQCVVEIPDLGDGPLVLHHAASLYQWDPAIDAVAADLAVLSHRDDLGEALRRLVGASPGDGLLTLLPSVATGALIEPVIETVAAGGRVLVVCSGRACAEEAARQLDEVGLSGRSITVLDARRTSRELVDVLRAPPPSDPDVVAAREHLSEVVDEMESVRARLDAVDGAYFEVVGESGQTYAGIVDALIATREDDPLFTLEELRPIVGRGALEDVEQLLDPVWPLIVRGIEGDGDRPQVECVSGSAIDALGVEEISNRLDEARDAELALAADRERDAPRFELSPDELDALASWDEEHGELIERLTPDDAALLDVAQALFPAPGAAGADGGASKITALERMQEEVDALAEPPLYAELFSFIHDLDPRAFEYARTSWNSYILGHRQRGRWLDRRWWRIRRRLRGVMRIAGLKLSQFVEFGENLRHHSSLRRLRRRLAVISADTARPLDKPERIRDAGVLQAAVTALQNDLKASRSLAAALRACPSHDAMFDLLRSDGGSEVRRRIHAAAERTAAEQRFESALQALDGVVDPGVLDELRATIDAPSVDESRWARAREELAAWSRYAGFRDECDAMEGDDRAILDALLARAAALRDVPEDERAPAVRRVLEREALLAWRDQAEQGDPSPRDARARHDADLARLGELERARREALRRVAASNPERSFDALNDALESDGSRLATRASVAEVVRSLVPHGLLERRPIWVTTPEAACDALPLRDDLFDIVLLLDAARLPAESAVACAARGRRVVTVGELDPRHGRADLDDSAARASIVECDDADAWTPIDVATVEVSDEVSAAVEDAEATPGRPFVDEVAEALRREGLAIEVDPVVGHELRVVGEDGQIALTVECHPPAAPSSPTPRPEVDAWLRLLPTRDVASCRLWSGGWLLDSDGEVARVMEASTEAAHDGAREPGVSVESG